MHYSVKRCLVERPGSNGPCLVLTDIRRDIRVTIDILVESSVPSRISVLTYGYPWRSPWYHGYPCRIIRASMHISMDIHGKLRIATRISTLTREHGPFDLGGPHSNKYTHMRFLSFAFRPVSECLPVLSSPGGNLCRRQEIDLRSWI